MFGSSEFWNAYYVYPGGEDRGVLADQSFLNTREWYCTYSELSSLIERQLHEVGKQKDSVNVLHVGCGDSLLGFDMEADGYCEVEGGIYNADFSSIVIGRIRSLGTSSRINSHVLLDISSGADSIFGLTGVSGFDLVIGKGCLDSLLARSDSATHVPAALHTLSSVAAFDGSILVFVCSHDQSRMLGVYSRSNGATVPLWDELRTERIKRTLPTTDIAPQDMYFVHIAIKRGR